jgi:hypothetical protein
MRARWSTVDRGEGGADRAVPRHSGRERACGERLGTLTRQVHEAARERGVQARATGADRAAPLGKGRGEGSVRGEKPRLTGGTHLSRGAGARPGWAELGCNGFLFLQGISNCCSILFSLGFSVQIQTKFQIQTNSNMCNNSKNI